LPRLGDAVEIVDSAPSGVLALRRDDLLCVVNCGAGDADVTALADPSTLVIATRSDDAVRAGTLPADVAAWFYPA
jgi:hypothetical protein